MTSGQSVGSPSAVTSVSLDETANNFLMNNPEEQTRHNINYRYTLPTLVNGHTRRFPIN